MDITIEDGDLLIDTFVYDKTSNNSEMSDEICTATAEDIEVLETNISDTEQSDELCVEDNVNDETTVNDKEVSEEKLLRDLKHYAILKGVTDNPSSLLSIENKCREFLASDLFCSDKRGEGVSIVFAVIKS